jgi:hypothetical protein
MDRLGRRLPLELDRELSEADWDRLVEVDDLKMEAADNVWQQVRREFLRREEAYRQEKESGISKGQV